VCGLFFYGKTKILSSLKIVLQFTLILITLTGGIDMMKRVSLQKKILTLVLSLVLIITCLLTGVNAYIEVKQTEESIGKRALQVSTAISLMPSVVEAFSLENPSSVIQPLVERIRKEIGAEFIVIGNQDSIRYSHPDPQKIGQKMVGGDNDKALMEGEYYTSKAVGSLGPSLRGKSPIFNEAGEVIGIVSVGFMIEDIKTIVFNRVVKMGGFALIVLFIGVIGSVLLARSIRKDTLGLEPQEIAALYRERNAVLHSIKEGIVSIDQTGTVTTMNKYARKILDYYDDYHNKKIEDILPTTKMYTVLKLGKTELDDEMVVGNRIIIVNRTPIKEDGKVVGVVSTFRDKTEIQQMINTLSEVKRYSEDLRAQTHEYTNKLYVLSGLLQLGHYTEAIELIQLESKFHQHQTRVLLEDICDHTVQAILLGKLGKASEKKVNLEIDPNSTIKRLPKHIDIAKLITILGNLLDNAIEAVNEAEQKEITFFTTDEGNDIIFEVADSGPGIQDQDIMEVFTRGFTTKGKSDRGYGLAIVKEVVNDLQGVIEVHNQKTGGVVFTVYLPKQIVKVHSA
jgi:two-component system, CitB family, sensor histidine kinase CitS